MLFAITYLVMLTAIVVGALALGMLPTIIAFRRGHPSRWLILAANVVLGATGIGWLLALVWALGLVHMPWEEQSPDPMFGDRRAELSLTYGTRPTAGSTSAKVAELEKLIKLRDGGFISQAEYERLKANFSHDRVGGSAWKLSTNGGRPIQIGLRKRSSISKSMRATAGRTCRSSFLSYRNRHLRSTRRQVSDSPNEGKDWRRPNLSN
jgi:hypothetical protein